MSTIKSVASKSTKSAPVAAITAATVPAIPATNWQLVGCVVAKPHSPKAGTTQAAICAILAQGPASMEQLQSALDKLPTAQVHPVLPLLRFMSRKQGYTFTCEGGAVRIGL